MRARGAAAVAGAIAIAIVTGLLVAAPATAAAVLTVDTFEDSYDGSCADGDCSLRDALASIDEGGTVRLPAGFYPLELAGSGGVEAGDLDVDRPATIVGIGETGAFLDASGLGDRAFEITATAKLERLTLLGGSDVEVGGIVRVGAGTTTIGSSTFLGGSATDGGAVAVDAGGAVRIVRSWISGSEASGRGGGLFVRGRASLTRSTVSGNRATAGGAAWVGAPASLLARSSTLSSNDADAGGGALHVRGTASIASTTVARNDAAVGGAILSVDADGVAVRSSVLEGNGATVRGRTCTRAVASGGYNLADGGGCGLDGPGDRSGVDPKLGPLGQHGGPTPTHALRPGSPAVGAGGPSCPSVDQRGAPRRDCDSGAYELVFCLGRPVTIVGTPGPDDLSGGLLRDVFLGRGGDDVFQGSLANDRACGGPGRDRLIGGPSDDRLAGSHGVDVLEGEGGDDLLLGGPGRDVCRGGDGRDVARACETTSSVLAAQRIRRRRAFGQ
jgi:CSLREA domain-containing protein